MSKITEYKTHFDYDVDECNGCKFENDGLITGSCCRKPVCNSCGEETTFESLAGDYEPDRFYCGRSERCLP